ncbi:uncharacterized protein LOC143355951 [Halictus rubicundus]|uniref:uncharacterized protein LOC143355951 n=1 Tax=Halictus rubicundus TaxID=77578 RepID=UPI00403500AE
MDADLDEFHNILLDANLPSSLNDLKNPTEEYVVNLINTFLKAFHIDVDTIEKPTKRQQDVMSHYDNADIIRLINLHVAMVQICDRIYINDLCITDIISPGSKRIRKQAKFLSNFILYANTKELEVGAIVSEMKNKAHELQEMLTKNDEVIKAIKDKELHITEQLPLKEKISSDIQAIKSRLSQNKEKYMKLTAEMTAAQEKQQKAMNVSESYKVQASNLSKTIAKLESEVVKTPEMYEKRLNELENQQSTRVKQREMMKEAFQEKMNLFEQHKRSLSFIQEQLDKLSEVQYTHQQLQKLNVQGDSLKKQDELLRTEIENYKKRLQTEKDKGNEKNEVNDLHMQCEQRLIQLRNLSAQLLRDKKTHQQTLEKEQVQHNEICLKLEEMQSVIKKLEEETSALIKNYQQIYDSEISKETALWETDK